MPFTIPFTATEITAFKDIALGISAIATGSAAVATATFAYKGLNKWKVETAFKAKFELAKEVVETSYKASNIINSLSAPIFLLHQSHFVKRLKNQKAEAIEDIKEQLQTLHIQSSALFGIEASEPIERYISVISNVSMIIETILSSEEEISEINIELNTATSEEDYDKLEFVKVLKKQSKTFAQLLIKVPPKNSVARQLLRDDGVDTYSDVENKLYKNEEETLKILVSSMQPHLTH